MDEDEIVDMEVAGQRTEFASEESEDESENDEEYEHSIKKASKENLKGECSNNNASVCTKKKGKDSNFEPGKDSGDDDYTKKCH